MGFWDWLCKTAAHFWDWLNGGCEVSRAEFDRETRDLWEFVISQQETVSILGEKLSVTQADLDALAASITTDVDLIKAEIVALQNANPNLDLSGLQAAVASLDATASPAPVDGE